MKIRRLSRGRIEAYNRQVRIRLEPQSGKNASRVIVFKLKPNRFYASRSVFEVQRPISIHEVIELYGGVESIAMLMPA